MFLFMYPSKKSSQGIADGPEVTLTVTAATAGGIAGATTLHSEKDRLNTVDMRLDYLYAAVKADKTEKKKFFTHQLGLPKGKNSIPARVSKCF